MDDNNPNKNERKDLKTIATLVNERHFSYPYIPTGIYVGFGIGLHGGLASIFQNIKTFIENGMR